MGTDHHGFLVRNADPSPTSLPAESFASPGGTSTSSRQTLAHLQHKIVSEAQTFQSLPVDEMIEQVPVMTPNYPKHPKVSNPMS